MRTYRQYCGLARALDHVGHRWTLLVVRELLLGPRRFTDLQHALPGIASNLLTDRLRQLEDDGLVTRRDLPPPAGSTVYELTPAGRDLEEAVHALVRWGGRFMLDGQGEDAFRPHWLALALDALGVGQVMDGTVVELVVDGERVVLTGQDGRIITVGDPARPPSMTITADPAAVLGVASGALGPAAARSAFEVEPAGAMTEALAVLGPPR